MIESFIFLFRFVLQYQQYNKLQPKKKRNPKCCNELEKDQ